MNVPRIDPFDGTVEELSLDEDTIIKAVGLLGALYCAGAWQHGDRAAMIAEGLFVEMPKHPTGYIPSDELMEASYGFARKALPEIIALALQLVIPGARVEVQSIDLSSLR